MRTYQIDEASFQLPEGWNDQSVNVFSPPGDLPGDFSLVISRDRLADGQEFGSYVESQLGELSNILARYRLIRRSDGTVGGLRAINAEFTWHSEEQTLAQRQTYVAAGPQVLIMTATAVDKITRDYHLLIDRILSTFKMQS
ncbi:MAG TPA: DUF1795 domain-containing protein [Blastocatellia bacterium]|nr:DUF1795 domain-containing protein [Blastocatellia bacterium]